MAEQNKEQGYSGQFTIRPKFSADAVLPDTTSDFYQIECSIRMPESGTYLFKIKSTPGVELLLNGKSVLKQNTNLWNARRSIPARFEYAADFKQDEDVALILKLTNEVKNADGRAHV